MSPANKSVVSALGIVAACGAVIAGVASRDSVDLHPGGGSGLNLSRSLASLSNEPPKASADDYYEAVSELLNRYYVDPITDENKLSLGAIRGMVISLDDADCAFMDPGEFKTFLNERIGKYEGIGADLSLEMPAKPAAKRNLPPTAQARQDAGSDQSASVHIPSLVVSAVVPGGPADKAGLKVGDSVDSVDGHWVLSLFALNKYNQMRDDVNAGRATRDQLMEMDRDIRKKLATSIMPMKARDRLIMGVSGTLKVTVLRSGKIVPLNVARAASSEEMVAKQPDGSLALHFFQGAAAKLKSEIGEGPITLDLRNNALGDPTEMKRCLSLFAPAGSYGEIVNEKNKPSRPLKIDTGEKPRTLKLIVDPSTKGVAAIFALALQSKGYAELVGGPVSPDRNIEEIVRLPDGSGYTLVTGKYVPAAQARRSA